MPRRSGEHAQLRLTADLVILTIRDDALHVLLIKRGNDPFPGSWALPGGFVSKDEPVDHTALRELEEETGIAGEPLHLEQIRTYGAPDRDPRGRVVTVAYLGIAPDLPEPERGTDAIHAAWVPADRVLEGMLKLAFDHRTIVEDAVERARSKLEYTSLATAFARNRSPSPTCAGCTRRCGARPWTRATLVARLARPMASSKRRATTASVRPGGLRCCIGEVKR